MRPDSSTPFRLLAAAFLAISAGGSGPLAAQEEPAVTGSLWGGARENEAADVSLLSDRTAGRVGDLLTIVVQLSTTSSKDQTSNTTRKASLDERILQLFFSRRTAETGDQGFNFYRSGGEAPGFGWNGTRSFDGGGTIDQRESLTTTIQARVAATGPNGVLQVEARRVFTAGQERSELVLLGFVRRDDIGRNNSVSSDKVADLQVHQVGVGPLSRDQQKGWLTRFFEAVNPF